MSMPLGASVKGSFWTPRRQAKLAELVAAGHSAREIARRLGDGCTKNMVIGRLHRAGQATGRSGQYGGSRSLTLDQRLGFDRVKQRGCAWVIGDPRGEWSWCGAAVVEPGKPYCAGHAKIARGLRQPVGTGVAPMPGRTLGLSRASVMD